MSYAAPSRRLYVGRVPNHASRLDLEDHFSSTGIKPLDVKLLTGYGFIEFDNVADAEDALRDFDGKDFMGDRLLVQFAKSAGPERRRFDDRDRDGGRGGMGGGRPAQGWRLLITNLAPGTSWQDLKDFARTAGQVHYAEVSRQDPGEGLIEYMSFSDADNALKTLDGVDMRGHVVKLSELTAPAGQSWSDPRPSPPRKDRRDDDRSYSRRERSRSPAYRRDDRDRRDRDRDDRYGGRRDDRDDRDRRDTRDRDYDRRDDRDRRSGDDDRRAPAPRRERSPRYD